MTDPAENTEQTPSHADDAAVRADAAVRPAAVNTAAVNAAAESPPAGPRLAIAPDHPDAAVTEADMAALAEQLGRPARGVVAIAARCGCGRPLVAVTAPRLPDGSPFPTTFYLTHPAAVAAVSGLEAHGVLTELTDRLQGNPELTAAYARAHEDYLARRAALGFGAVPEIDRISAGGMPTRVKCLHALLGHALAAGPGVNPFGDEALALISPVWRPDRCAC